MNRTQGTAEKIVSAIIEGQEFPPCTREQLANRGILLLTEHTKPLLEAYRLLVKHLHDTEHSDLYHYTECEKLDCMEACKLIAEYPKGGEG